MTVQGANALVTGGSQGIGEAIVRHLRDGGARVAVLEIESAEGADLAVTCDVADEKAVMHAVGEVVDAFGDIQYAFLNAGVGALAPLLAMPLDEWDRIQGVNLRGAFLCLRECAAAMVERGTRGSIVATGSVSGTLADRAMAHYNSSKAGLASLARVAAAELGPHGIRVNVIAPGTTDTPLFRTTDAVPGYRDAVAARTPLGGIGTADDVAAAAIALAQLEWVTGQVLAVDGGVSLWSPIDIADFLPDA